MGFYSKPLSSTIFPSSNLFVLCYLILMMISESATGYTLDLIHRDSPSSPFYNPSHTQLHRQRSSFLRSIARSSSKLSSPATPFSGEYLAKFRIGTPPVEVLAIIDTHSDLTWTQCLPCDNANGNTNNGGCYKQKTPLFDPTKSKTYRNLTCGSHQCALLDDASPGLLPGCDQDQQPCTYAVFYRSDDVLVGTSSQGDIAMETLTFDDSNTADLVFGCGHDNTGEYIEKASGVLGLGRGSVSIVNQLATNNSISGGAKYFSYCLTSESDDSDVSGKIRFGTGAVVANTVGSTPMRNNPSSLTRQFYSVTLEGISIGSQRVEYSSDPKTLKRRGNFVIDSSIAMTVLTTSFYDRLESVLVKAMVNGTTAKRVPDPRKTNGLCYENGGKAINSPPITVHFDQGVDLLLSNENTFLKVGEEGVFCLTFSRGNGDNPSVGFLGNIHQRNYLIGFDLDNLKVDFKPTDCAKLQ